MSASYRSGAIGTSRARQPTCHHGGNAFRCWLRHGAFGKWHLGHTEGRFPTDQSFDEWFGIPNSSDEAYWPNRSMCQPNSDPFAGPEYVMESTKGQVPKKLKVDDLAYRRVIDRELTDKTKDFITRRR